MTKANPLKKKGKSAKHVIKKKNRSFNVDLQISVCLTALVLTIAAEERPRNTVSVSSGTASIQSNTIQKLIKILEKYGLEEQRGLKRVYLSNRSITCNDGSQAGFYLRKSHGSRRWIIFLEGGWYCYDHKSCRNRWLRLRHLMTSTQWPETRDGEQASAFKIEYGSNLGLLSRGRIFAHSRSLSGIPELVV